MNVGKYTCEEKKFIDTSELVFIEYTRIYNKKELKTKFKDCKDHHPIHTKNKGIKKLILINR